MCGGLSVPAPATTDRDVSFDSRNAFDLSSTGFSFSTIVPNYSPATSAFGGESSTDDPLQTPGSYTTPSYAGSSPPHDLAPEKPSCPTARQGSLPTQLDFKFCEMCQEQFDGSLNLVNHLNNKHRDIPNFCGQFSCKRKGRWNRRELIRHLNTTKAHQGSATPVFRCRCKSTFTRKEKFRDHFKKLTCEGDEPVVCRCGIFTFDCRNWSDVKGFNAHFEECGRGKRGRRPKERIGMIQESNFTSEVFTPG